MPAIDLSATVGGNASGELVLRLTGDLDMASAYLVSSWMNAFRAGSTYVIDLSGVTFIDSHGLAALLEAQASAEATNASLTLRSPSKQALDLLMLTGLDLHFTIALSTTQVAAQ
jgi:anti-sigma B factor antagonist